jgi:superfamily II DNA or RNA helicase
MVGKQVVRLLVRLNPSLGQPEQLRDLVMSLREPAEFLLDPSIRRELLDLLPPDQAEALATRLSLKGEPYEALAEMDVRRGTARAAELFDFFSIAPPTSLDHELSASRYDVDAAHALFEHQRRAAWKVHARLASEPGRVLLHMPTGSGKTRTAMSVISDLLNEAEPRLVIWLAHSEELCDQAVEEFTAAWRSRGNRSVAVQKWWGSYELEHPIPRDGIVVAGLSKAYSSAKRSMATLGQFAGRVDLVVMDEAHQAVAPTYEFVLSLLTQAGKPTPMLGLSATPGRTWNDVDEDERLADFFFRQKVTLQVEGYESPIDYLIDEGYLARVEYDPMTYTSEVALTPRELQDLADGLDISPRVLRQLAEDEQRNLLIVHRSEQLARRHSRILVFAATVEHALVLAAVLRSRGLWAYPVTGNTPPAERARVIRTYRDDSPETRVLVNYGVLTTGFDAPRTSAAVIARPTTSLVLYSQMVGRAIRGPRAGGNAEAEIVTVVDTALPGFKSVTESFTNWEDVWEKA